MGRARKDAPNRYGCVVGKDESEQETQQKADAVTAAAAAKENKEENVWTKHRAKARESETALLEAGGSPGASLKQVKGAYVERLKGLHISRTGKVAPVGLNNKPGEGGAESTLLQAFRRALAQNDESRVPPTPTRLALDEAVDEEEAVGDAAVITCEDCGRELAEEGVQPKDGEELPANRDFYIGDGGRAWCRCGSPAEELDRA